MPLGGNVPDAGESRLGGEEAGDEEGEAEGLKEDCGHGDRGESGARQRRRRHSPARALRRILASLPRADAEEEGR